MHAYSLSRLPDEQLTRDLGAVTTRGRASDARVLAHVLEFDRRKLFLPGYASMYRYCVDHLRMSEDVAYKRIVVARVARLFPLVFDAIADGRLSLSAVMLIARHVTRENGRELLEAVMRRSREEIKDLVARRFPASVAATLVLGPVAGVESAPMDAPAAEGPEAPEGENRQNSQHFSPAPGRVDFAGVFGLPAPNVLPELHMRIDPIAPGRYQLVAVIDQAAHDALVGSKDLLGHAVPAGQWVGVLKRALLAQYEQLRKRRCGATRRPRKGVANKIANPRRIPAAVVRAVWERDGGQCTHVSPDGHRCGERFALQMDHIVPRALGGQSTVENLRLLCHAHNQHAAEREFGRSHVEEKREAAKQRRAAERYYREKDRERTEKRKAEIARQREELAEAFRTLGYRGRDFELALAYCATRPEAPPEERLKYALGCLAPRAHREHPSNVAPPACAEARP